MKPSDALLFLDLDRQSKQDEGTLFDEPRRRLSSDPGLRADWAQYQALRALAWECAPEPGERLLRQVLQQARRERVQGQLARGAGSEDLARQILLGRRESSGVPSWVWLLLLCASLGLGAMAWHQGLIGPEPSDSSAAPKNGDDAVAFEFPTPAAPAEAALGAPPARGPAEPDTEDVKHEDSASRQARQLVSQHLHQAEARAAQSGEEEAPGPGMLSALAAHFKAAVQPKPTDVEDGGDGQTTALQAALLAPQPDAVVLAEARAVAAPAQAPAHAPAAQAPAPQAQAPAATQATPRPTPHARPQATLRPTPAPTPKPAATPAPAPTRIPPAAPVVAQAQADAPSADAGQPAAANAAQAPLVSFSQAPASATAAAAGSADQAGMSLDSNDIVVGGRLRATLVLPDARAVDLRLFDIGGKPVRTIADTQAGPGTVIYSVDAKDDHGQALGAGTYYLRVMTAWFSRVEPIQIH